MARTVLVCVLAAVVAVVLVSLTGCAGASRSAKLSVVASTDVYGDIARQVGGSNVAVTSVLTDPNADPHLFEPGTANGLAVSRAGVVIQNGLGYDAFMTRLERAAPNGDRVVVTVADVLGIRGNANPHLWYAVPALPKVAAAIAAAFARADARHAAAYRRGLRAFLARTVPLQRAVARIRAAHGGASVATTEPVPEYLLRAAGLRDLAPASFTRPIEEGTEPSAAAVSAMVRLVASRRVQVLLYNRQAVSPITARVREAARHARIPVVGITETLPAGETFQQWQLRQIDELGRALGA